MEDKKKWRIVLTAIIVLSVVAVMQSMSLAKVKKELKKERANQTVYQSNASTRNAESKPRTYSQRVYDPWRSFSGKDELDDIDKLQRRMVYTIGEMLRSFSSMSPMMSAADFDSFGFSPSVDMEESDQHWIIRLDVPGLEKDKIDIEVRNGMLTVQGERKSEKTTDDASKGFYASEIQYGSFARQIALPPSADESKVDASYDKGVLTVKIGKKAEAEEPVQQVKVT